MQRDKNGLYPGVDLLVEREVAVDGHTVNVAVGPDNGSPVVLLHGQGSRWQDHERVLPSLIERHRVYAIDLPGHGRSGRLPMGLYTNTQVGELLARTIDELGAEPAIVAGHGAGGVLALWIAANRPDLVSGLLLEDPLLFSSVPPLASRTAAATVPRLATTYLQTQPAGSFQRYYVEHGDHFAFLGPLAGPVTRYCRRWIDRHPGRALRIGFLPRVVSVYFEGLIDYDPAVGVAWNTGRWYHRFDTAAALAAVTVPATLIHTTWWYDLRGTSYNSDGVLMAAMDTDDAARAVDLLPDAELVTVGSRHHLVHFERPNDYLDALNHLSERIGEHPVRQSAMATSAA